MEAQAMLILSVQYIGFLPCHVSDAYVAAGFMRALRPQTYQFLSPHYAAYRRADQDQALLKLFLRELRAQPQDRADDGLALSSPARRE
jgi:hypothetical protein